MIYLVKESCGEMKNTTVRLEPYVKESVDQLPKPTSQFIREAVKEKLHGTPNNKTNLKERKQHLKKQKKRTQKEFDTEIEKLNTKINSINKKLSQISKIKKEQNKKIRKHKKELKKALKNNTYQHIPKKGYIPKNAYKFDLNQSKTLKKLDEETWAKLLTEIHKQKTGKELEKIKIVNEENSERFFIEIPDDTKPNSLLKS